jgi:hypothetical protein
LLVLQRVVELLLQQLVLALQARDLVAQVFDDVSVWRGGCAACRWLHLMLPDALLQRRVLSSELVDIG